MTDARRPPAKPERRVRLDFRDHADGEAAQQEVRSNLSSVTACGRCLWVSNDELATVERLLRQDDGGFAEHVVMQLAELFDLPEDEGGEMDIEGLDIADGYLWVVGSHSLTRAKPKPGENDAAEALARLSEVEHHPNRHFLGRIPLVEAHPTSSSAPRADEGKGQTRHSGCLKITSEAMRSTRSSGTTCTSPASWPCRPRRTASTSRASPRAAIACLLGLRGPVLRGWALLLELQVKERKRGRLKLRKLGPDGERYAKHFLDLEGPRHPRARVRRRRAPDPRRADHGPRRPGRALPLAGRARRRPNRRWCRRTSWSACWICPTGAASTTPRASACCRARPRLRSCWWSTIRRPRTACTRRPRSMPTSSGSSGRGAAGSRARPPRRAA